MAARILHCFTPAEVTRLRKLYPTNPARKVAALMGLSVKQVYNAADRYQIFKEGYSGERRKPERQNKVYKPRPPSNRAAAQRSAVSDSSLPAWLAPPLPFAQAALATNATSND